MTPCQDTLRMSFTILKKKNFQIWTNGRKRSEEKSKEIRRKKKERDQKKKRKEVRGKMKGRRLVAFLFVNQILSVKVFIHPKYCVVFRKGKKRKEIGQEIEKEKIERKNK